MSKFYTVQQMAKLLSKLDVTESKLYYDIERGRIQTKEVAGKMVIYPKAFEEYKKKLLQKKALPTPAQYCEKHGMSRSKFDYRVRAGKIAVVRLGGKLFVKGEVK